MASRSIVNDSQRGHPVRERDITAWEPRLGRVGHFRDNFAPLLLGVDSPFVRPALGPNILAIKLVPVFERYLEQLAGACG